MITKFIVGPLSDNMPFVGDKARVIIFASISQYMMAACFIVLALLPSSALTLSIVCFTASVVFSGMNAVGVTKSCQLVSQQSKPVFKSSIRL